jgi:TP901 family phage tail tape measure protein|nr:MAG TPA: tail tape measure protein [Caudoviricetes sp.]
MAGNTQEFVTIIRLNSEEAKNNLADLKRKVDELTVARDKAISAKADTNFIKDLNKDLKKARAELKAYDTDINKTIKTINSLSTASVGEIETAMKALRRQMKSTSDPADWRNLSALMDTCKERLDEIKNSASQTDEMFEKISSSGKLVASVLADIDNASVASLKAAQSSIEQRLTTINPSSANYEEQNANLLKIKARLAEIGDKQKLVNTIVDQYNSELDNAGLAMRKVVTNTELVNRTMKSLDKASIRDIEYSLRIVNNELKDMERGTEEFRQMTKKAKELKTQLESVRAEGAAQESWINRLADKFNRMQTLVFSLIASLTGLTLTMRKSTQDFLDMDSAMANVTKYTGQTMEEVKEMNKSFQQMDTRTSREELNGLAAAAGRLGITSEAAIKEFVDGSDKIRVALGDDLGENAVDQIGKLAQMFGEDKTRGLRGAMLATGSAVNELAQNSSASAAYMVDFTAQLSGVAIQAGITQSEMLGLASALDQNQQEAATSATVFSQLITKMFQEPARFAKIAGLEVKEFSRIMKEDANTGLITFLESMRSRGGFDAMAPLFQEMKLDGTRAVGVLSSVASHLDQVRQAQALAFQAYEDGTSVIKEFNVQNNTEQAQLDKAKKRFHDLSVELGERLLPLMRYVVTTSTLLVRAIYNLTTFIIKYKAEIAYLIVSITMLTAVYKASTLATYAWYVKEYTLMLLHKTHNVLIKTRIALIGTLRVAVALLTGNITKAAAALKVMRAASLTNPYTALLAVVLSLGYGIYKLYSYIKSSSEEAKRNAEAVKRMKDSYNDIKQVQQEAASAHSAEITQIQTLRRVLENANNGIRERRKALVQLQDIVPQYHATLTTEGKLINNNTSALDNYVNNLKKAALAQAALNKMAGLNSSLMETSLLKGQREGNQSFVLKKLASYGFDPRTQEYGSYISGGGFVRDKQSGTFLRHITDEQLDGINRWMKAYNYNLKKIQEYTNAAEAINNKIDDIQDYATKQGADFTQTSTPAQSVGGSSNTSNSFHDNSEKKENENKERERKFKEEMKKYETDMKTSLLDVDAQYTSGQIRYTEYIKQRLEALQTGYDNQLELLKKYGKTETSEYDNLLAKKKEADAQYLKDKAKIDEQDLQRTKVLAEAKIKAMYYDPNNAIYMDEDAMNEALFQNDVQFLLKKKNLYKESAEEYRQLEEEIDDMEFKHKLEQETSFQQKVLKMKEEYLNMGSSRKKDIELKALDEIYWKALISEEEYQQMKLAIMLKYSEKYKTQEQKDKEFANMGLSLAKDMAGIDENTQQSGDAITSIASLFTSVEQQKKVNEALKELYQEDVLNYDQYIQAKSISDDEFLDKRLRAYAATFSSVASMLGSFSSYSQACADAETAKIQQEYDKQIEAAGNNSAKREKLEEERDEKIKKAKNAANKRAMPIEIAQALASTAAAAINAYASASKVSFVLGPIAAAAATAAGMAQVAIIKKQHEAQSAGYYEGGFTGGTNYRRKAGFVHEGEFVANHNAVNNSAIRPALQLIDLAQRNNTVGSLTAADITRSLNTGGNAIVSAPVVNVTTDNEALNATINSLHDVLGRLNVILSNGRIKASVSIDGEDGVAYNLDKYNKMKGRK